MKILLYLPTPGGLTGAPRRLLTLSVGMRNLGALPVVVTEPGTPLMQAAQEAGIETVSLVPVGILALREGALFGGGLIFKLRVAGALLIQQWRFWRVLRATRSDAVWMRGSKSIAFAGLSVLLSRRPLVLDVDDELPSRGVVRLLHRAGLALARRVVFQHDAAHEIFGEKLAHHYAAKMRVLTPGIDVDTFGALRERDSVEQISGRGRFRILQVGTLCDRKNQAFMIEVLSQLPPNLLQRVELRFAGGTHNSDYERMLRHDVAERGLCDSVSFLGWRDDVHSLMLESDLLVMPSKSEGVPNTVQEAMLLGLPVLGSDRGGIPEVVEHLKTGWILPLKDPNYWVETLGIIIGDRDACAKVSAAAQTHSQEHFGTEEWCRRYLALIRDIIL